MIEKLKNKKTIDIALCLVALLGFIFPTFVFNINILHRSQEMSIGVRNIFQNMGASGNELSVQLSQRGGGGLAFTDIGANFILSIGAYILALILVVIVLFLIIIDKLPKIRAALTGISFFSCIYAGIGIWAIPDTIENLLTSQIESFGGTGMIDLSGSISINHGAGYWLMFIAIGSLLLIKLATLMAFKNQKNYAKELCKSIAL